MATYDLDKVTLKRKEIPFADIVVLDEIKLRPVDSGYVSKIAEAIAEGVVIPEMIVVPDTIDGNAVFLLSDGRNRHTAYSKNPPEKIFVEVATSDGTPKSLALFLNIVKNATHGKALSRVEKRNAVKLALGDVELRRKSDNQLAKMCGVSAKLVADIRLELAGKKEETPDVDVGAHARKRPAKGGDEAGPSGDVETLEDRLEAMRKWLKGEYIDFTAIRSVLDKVFGQYRHLQVPKKCLVVIRSTSSDGEEELDLTGCSVEMVDGKLHITGKEVE